MSEAIQGKVICAAVVVVDDAADLLMLGEAVPSAKKQILHRIKRALYDKAENLTEDDIAFTTLHIPDHPAESIKEAPDEQ